MDRAQILNLYDWAEGVCFRHPSAGEVPTTVVGAIHPRGSRKHNVRACRDCVIALEDIKREAARREGREYKPGRVGEPPG